MRIEWSLGDLMALRGQRGGEIGQSGAIAAIDDNMGARRTQRARHGCPKMTPAA